MTRRRPPQAQRQALDLPNALARAIAEKRQADAQRLAAELLKRQAEREARR